MERHLGAQFEGLLDEAADRADGDAAERLRARFAADVTEALEHAGGASEATAAGADDADALARAAAYLDGRLAGPEREAFLTALAASPRRRADLASTAALLGTIEAEPKSAPPELLARAGSAFAPRATHAKSARPMFAWRYRALGWSLATLALLVFVPGALVLVGGRLDWPFHSEAPSSSLDAQGPQRLDQSLPGNPAAPPTDSFKLKADVAAPAREPVDMARSAPEPCSCETVPAPTADELTTAVPAETAERPSSRTTPCPPSVGAAGSTKSLDARGHDSEDGAAAPSRSVPSAPSAILPAVR